MSDDMAPEDAFPDNDDRVRDFLTRHGGPGSSERQETAESGIRGWSEVYAADGYTLRCDWSQTGGRKEMQFTEVPPVPAQRSP